MIDVIDWPAPFTTVQEEWEERIRSGPVVGMVIPGKAGEPPSFEVVAIRGDWTCTRSPNERYYTPEFPTKKWRDIMVAYARARGEWYDTEEESEEWG